MAGRLNEGVLKFANMAGTEPVARNANVILAGEYGIDTS